MPATVIPAPMRMIRLAAAVGMAPVGRLLDTGVPAAAKEPIGDPLPEFIVARPVVTWTAQIPRAIAMSHIPTAQYVPPLVTWL